MCRAGCADPDAASNTLKLLDSLLATEELERVFGMFDVGPSEGGGASGLGGLGVDAAGKDGDVLFRTKDWSRSVLVVVCLFQRARG